MRQKHIRLSESRLGSQKEISAPSGWCRETKEGNGLGLRSAMDPARWSDLLVRVDLSVAFIRKTFVIPDKPPSAEPGKPNYNCHRQ